MKKTNNFLYVVLAWILSSMLSVKGHTIPRSLDVVLGKEGALTVIEYASLSCGGCAHFAKEFLPIIEKEFVNSGKVRLVIRSIVMTSEDVKATMLVCCHPEPHKLQMAYWKRQSEWIGASNDEPIRKIAQENGMTSRDMDACLADNQLRQALFAKKLIALKGYHIEAIPTIVINGKQYPNIQTADDLRKVIEEVLKEDHNKKTK